MLLITEEHSHVIFITYDFFRPESNVYRKSTEEKDEPEEVIIKDQSVEVERHNDIETMEEVEDEEEEEEEEDDKLLDLLDVREHLILKKEGEEGPEIRGGPVDALIVHVSKGNKNGRVISLPCGNFYIC